MTKKYKVNLWEEIKLNKSIDEEYKKYDNFIEMLNFRNGKNTKIEIFKDLVVMMALKIKNSVYPEEIDEDTYKTILNKYEKEEIKIFNKLINYIMELYIENNEVNDILGEIFEYIGGDEEYNRFHTPKSIANAETEMTIDLEIIKNRRVTRIGNNECNSGSIILAIIRYLQSNKIDYTKKIYIEADDTELVYVCMAYIQAALYELSACIIWKKETGEIRRMFYTPQYYKSGWLELFKMENFDE